MHFDGDERRYQLMHAGLHPKYIISILRILKNTYKHRKAKDILLILPNNIVDI